MAQLVTTSIIFIYFSKESTASIICTFWYNFAVQKLSFIEHATSVFGPRSVLQANLSNLLIYLVCLLSHSWDLGPTGSDSGLSPQDSTYWHNKLGYLGRRPRVGWLLVEFSYLLENELRTLGVNWVNEFAI